MLTSSDMGGCSVGKSVSPKVYYHHAETDSKKGAMGEASYFYSPPLNHQTLRCMASGGMSLALCHRLMWQGEKRREQPRRCELQHKGKEAMGLRLET